MPRTLFLGLSAVLVILLVAACAHQHTSPQSLHRSSKAGPEGASDPSGGQAGAPLETESGPQADFGFPRHAPGSGFTSPEPSDVFPIPRSLEPQVGFWRKVYSVWSRSEVAIHDDRDLDVVYEVVHLPGEIGEGYTAIQQEIVRERLDYWRSRLADLETKAASGTSLDADERRLALRVARNADFSAVLTGASERVRCQRGLRERFKRGLEISGRYDQRFREIFRAFGLPEDLAYLPHVESSFQARARSSAGAVGLWQFTPAAARRFMDAGGRFDERLNPVASTRGAARYLDYAYARLGSWPLALTSYNHGIGGMLRAKDQFGQDFARIVGEYDHPQFGFASRNFYAEFLAAREIARQPEAYFPEGLLYEAARDHDEIIPMRVAHASGRHPLAASASPRCASGIARGTRRSKATGQLCSSGRHYAVHRARPTNKLAKAHHRGSAPSESPRRGRIRLTAR